jgi:5-methylcytosine-specific restriction endonuclease McrA
MTEYEKKLKRFLIPVLRRATYRWKDREEAKKAARVERGLYKCAGCSELFGPNDVVIDHIDPVVSIEEGFIDWNAYVTRMFPEQDGFQILCNPCHDLKTSLEDNLRTSARQKRKEEEKELKKQEKERKKLNKKLAKQKQ